MAVLQLRDRGELARLLSSSKVVLVAVVDSRSPHGRYVAGLLEDVDRSVGHVIPVASIDAAEVPSLAREAGGPPPRLMLYIEGSKVWEQIGFFYSASSDRYAIRRGMLMALRRRGLSPARLGVRLDF